MTLGELMMVMMGLESEWEAVVHDGETRRPVSIIRDAVNRQFVFAYIPEE